MDNVAKAHGLVKQYASFGALIENDACSSNNRCDLQQFSKQNFFESAYSQYSHDQSTSCFDPKVVLGDFLNHTKATINPLKRSDKGSSDLQTPVPAGQCTRCCKMTTALREYWTSYRCGSDYDARFCDGDIDQTCSFKQCLVLTGDTVATVTAQLKPSVVADSGLVADRLGLTSYQASTQVHRVLECASFNSTTGTCAYKAKLSDLVDTTQVLALDATLNAN